MNQKEERELCNELDALGFQWERTKNGHIKAVAPDGKTFTFSTGGSYRNSLNQRGRLRRWQKENAPVAPVEEVVEETGDPDEWSMVILEEMTPGEPFTAVDVANRTALSKEQAVNAIEYLNAFEILESTNGGYLIPVEREVPVALSHLAMVAIEAMAEAIRLEVQGNDEETYKIANEAFKSENAKLRTEILDAHGEVTLAKDQVKILQQQIRDMEDLIEQWRAGSAKLQDVIDKRDREIKELKEEISKLGPIAKKYADLKSLFSV